MADGERERPENGLSVLRERLDHVIRAQNKSSEQLNRIERDLARTFITRDEFNRLADSVVFKDGRYWLVERLVFGIVGIIVTATIAAILLEIGLGR